MIFFPSKTHPGFRLKFHISHLHHCVMLYEASRDHQRTGRIHPCRRQSNIKILETEFTCFHFTVWLLGTGGVAGNRGATLVKCTSDLVLDQIMKVSPWKNGRRKGEEFLSSLIHVYCKTCITSPTVGWWFCTDEVFFLFS